MRGVAGAVRAMGPPVREVLTTTANAMARTGGLIWRPLPAEETFEEIAADEARWDAQFESTGGHKLAALVAAVEVEINEGKVVPMFDEYRNVVLDYDEYERLLR